MTTNNDTSLLILNDLMLVARDSAEGFRTAAEHVKEPELMELFAEYARQRDEFRQEIEERIRTLRGEPAKLPNPVASAHRAWMGLKAAIEKSSSHALLEECERGEDMSVKAYAMALKTADVDKLTHELVQQQYEQVQATHDRVRQLRDSATYAYR